jgi:hypothetical protein
MPNSITLDDLAQVNRLETHERERLAAEIIADLRAIAPVHKERGARDKAGIAARGRSVYDEVLASKPRTAHELTSARWALLSLGASMNVIDAIESAEASQP